MRRKNWKPDEDKALIQISSVLNNNWKKVSKQMIELGFKRSSKSCKERFYNYLNPDISREKWTSEEITKLFELQDQYGNRWRRISRELPHRSDCRIKNQFYSIVRKVLRRLYKCLQNSKTGTKINDLKGSKVTKDIKPSVISRIFCVQSNEEKESEITKDFAIIFKSIIMKYRNFQSKQTVDPNDINLIKLIFETLQNLNQTYNEHCQLKKKIKPNDNESQFIQQKRFENFEKLLDRIQKRKAIFTSDTYGIEKLYKKFVNNCAYPSSFVYQQFQSQNQENSICLTPYMMSTEQFLYFQSIPSFYSMNQCPMMNQQSQNLSNFSSTGALKKECHDVKEEQDC